MLVLDLLVVPGAFIFSLRLVCKVIQDAGTSNFENTLPLIGNAMRSLAVRTAYDDVLVDAYEKALIDAHIGYGAAAWYDFSREGETREEVLVRGSGIVRDVDLVRLRRLGSLLSALGTGITVELSVRPGDRLGPEAMLVIRRKRASKPGDHKPDLPNVPSGLDAAPGGIVPAASRGSLAKALRGLFLTRSASAALPGDIRKFLTRMGAEMFRLARDAKAVELTHALGEFERLVEGWLEIRRAVAPKAAVPAARASFLAPDRRFGGPLEIDCYDLMRWAASSKDPETCRAVVGCYGRCVGSAKDARQQREYQHFLDVLGFGYSISTPYDALRDAVGAEVDRYLGSILRSFASGWTCSQTADEALADKPYLLAALSLCLALIRSAIEAGDTKHGVFFFERLVEHQRFAGAARRRTHRAPTQESAQTIYDYAVLALYAWAVHFRRNKGGDSAESARELAGRARGYLPTREGLVALWELYHSNAGIEAPINRFLGVARWDLGDNDEERLRFKVWAGGREDWLGRGLYSAILAASSMTQQEAVSFFEKAPPLWMWDISQEELERAASAEWSGIITHERKESTDRAMALLQARQKAAREAYEEHAAKAPLDPARCRRLESQTKRSVDENRQWIEAIRGLGGLARPANRPVPIGPFRQPLPRCELISNACFEDPGGDWIGQRIAHAEAVATMGTAEDLVRACGKPLKSLAQLPEALRDVRRELASRGYEPNLVILPSNERFALALFQKPLWQVDGRREFGECSYGMWEGLWVFRFPYSDAKSVILADASGLFGASRDGPEIEAAVRDFTEQELAELAQERANAPEPLNARDNGPQALLVVRVVSPVGICVGDGGMPNAALKLDISRADGGYAMVRGDFRYHAPFSS
jgi:hypothetical protein